MIDWTSGTVLLDGSETSGSGQRFTFTLRTSAASDDYPTPDDYRLRIYHHYQPQFGVMFRITDHDHEASNEAREDAIEEDDDFPHHLERYLFQFWPLPTTREILVDETELQTHSNPLHSSGGWAMFWISFTGPILCFNRLNPLCPPNPIRSIENQLLSFQGRFGPARSIYTPHQDSTNVLD